MLTLIHPTGPSPLMFQHLNGSKVQKSVVTTTLRNVFTDALPVGDYEVGGPCDPGELFAYCRLPWPVYAYIDGVTVTYSTGTKMELAGWSMLTGLNPQWNGLGDISIRLQDYVKLPNNMYDNATAAIRQQQLKEAFNKGTIYVTDPLGVTRIMRFQRLGFTYEEPKERHDPGAHMQATASCKLIDQLAELNKAETLIFGGVAISQPQLSPTQQ